jgi:outer membrane protein insertion porin family
MKPFPLFFFLAVISFNSQAEFFEVEDIRIDGLERVSSATVFNSLSVSVGDVVDRSSVRDLTRDLFRLGFFNDIKISRDKGILIISVTERPAVAKLIIEGNTAIPEETLFSSLRDNGLSEGQIFRQAVLKGMSQELERQYVKQGRYGASVEIEVEELPQNRVAVTVLIDEGEVAAISGINIVGNLIFDDSTLKPLFELKESNLLSFISQDDKYNREKLTGDIERVESYYLNRGYLDFSVESTQVTISPDRDSVFITINIKEGSIHTVSEIVLAGNPMIPEKEIRSLIVQKEGEDFSQYLMTFSSEKIAERLGNDGYAFAEVKGVTEINNEDKTTKILFYIDPGKRAYVRRIEFRGNTKTMDEVLRREMRQIEGATASTEKIAWSKNRLQRTGFFKTVESETRPVPGVSDQIDVFYTVEEQPSGSVGASFGVAQSYGVTLGASIAEQNFLGTGNKLKLGLNQNGFQTNLNLNYMNPYFTEDGVTAGFMVFAKQQDFDEGNLSNYKTDSMGASTTFGWPISEIQSIGFGFGVEQLEMDTGGNFKTRLMEEFLDEEGDDYLMFTSNLSWGISTLNGSGNDATRGQAHKITAEITMPLGDLNYYKFNYDGQFFHTLSENLVLHLHANGGYGDGYLDTDTLPFFKNFYSGGNGSVRGFKQNTLGPRDVPITPGYEDEADAFGGNVVVEGTVELLFPMPFLKDKNLVQMALFFDAGNVFDTDCGNVSEDFCQEPSISDLRYSIGIGGTWKSGFGPISVSFASPFNTGKEDEKETFQFNMGGGF